MSHGNDQLAAAVQEALKEGEIAAPNALVALVGTPSKIRFRPS